MQTKKCPYKAEEALVKSETRYRELAKSIKGSLLVFNRDWTIAYANDYSTETVGLTPKDLVGKNVWELFPNLKNTIFWENYHFTMEKREKKTFEAFGPYHKQWFEIRAFPSEEGIVVLALDITERKKAEEALRLSEENYKHLLQFAPAAIFEIDYQGPRFLSVNEAACQLSGYSREELLSMNLFKLLEPESAELWKDRIRRGRAGEKISSNVEFKVITKDGSRLDTLLHVKHVYKEGKIDTALIVLYDLTERKKAEERLRQNQETFIELVERAPFGIYVVDSQFRISHMNRSSQNEAFRNVRPVIGRYFSEAMHILWPEPTASEITNHFRRTLETGEPYYSTKFVEPRHDVENVESYEWELHRITLPDGQFGVICYYFDSTKVRETEQALRRAQEEMKNYTTNLERIVEERTKQLKDSERLTAIGVTAGMVGHDIRNPLHAMNGDVFLAKADLANLPDSQEKKELNESLNAIEENIFYINKIVADLQDFARPLNPHAQQCDIRAIIEQSLNNHAIPANVEAIYSVEKDVETILADSDFLQRIISNLTLNAVQAIPNGGKVIIHAFKDKETSDTIITVKDNGVGIPENVREKMFTPMFTTKSKGQGFGLAVVKRLTEGLGGSVSFDSQVKKGTTFTVRLPPPPKR
jgi:PAS domain S-box-containing protein